MINLLIAVFTAYILTAVITGSSLLAPIRDRIIDRTPWLQITADHPHFVECRLCVGFWISLAIWSATGWPLCNLGLIYGASYFLATQER